jgi:hypothetical protein
MKKQHISETHLLLRIGNHDIFKNILGTIDCDAETKKPESSTATRKGRIKASNDTGHHLTHFYQKIKNKLKSGI